MSDFFNIEGKILDKEQQESAIYIGNELVIAGAGAGKTLSIVGKVKYLLQHEHIPYEQILVLAFTDKVVSELKERIGKISSGKVDILTFHKLGMRIFNKTENEKEIETKGFYGFIKDYLVNGKYLKNKELASAIYNFVNRDYGNYDLVNDDDLQELVNDLSKVTLNGEKVNNLSALITCNMLFTNNVEYKYIRESRYNHHLSIGNSYCVNFTNSSYDDRTLSLKGKSYQDVPKFIYIFLKDTKFAIDRYKDFKAYLNNPQAVKAFEELSENLISAQKIASAADAYNDDLDDLIDRFCEDDYISSMFIEILKTIRMEYYAWLKEEKRTDFDYMIKGSVEILRNLRAVNYKYIIVDEYQDISPARFNLLSEILKQKDGYLMAYGDDWQSIYGFSGSNNKFFMNFSKYFVDAKEFYLKNSYRNSQQLIDMSTSFIMKNPDQKEKSLQSNKQLEVPIHLLQYESSNIDSFLYCIYRISKRVDKPKTLMVLGRTNYAIEMLKRIPELKEVSIDNNDNRIFQYDGFDLINIVFLTIHRAKGLEADYVFVTKVNSKEFPYEKDEKYPYLNILHKLNEYEEEKQHEEYLALPDSEERRLFYVALTRSKNDVYLSIPGPKIGNIDKSVYIKELYNINSKELNEEIIPRLYELPHEQKCPHCNGFMYSTSKGAKTYNFCENKCSIYGIKIDNDAIIIPNKLNCSNNIKVKIEYYFEKSKFLKKHSYSFTPGKTIIKHRWLGMGLVLEINRYAEGPDDYLLTVNFNGKVAKLVLPYLLENNLYEIISK